MKVINLWGGPGAGKSTTAAGLFYKMKKAGYNVELVTEYAKDLVWDERHKLFKDQLYLLSKQNRRLDRLEGKVEYAISDSPLLLVLAYMPEGYYSSFNKLTFDVWNNYLNFNFVLNRAHEYTGDGRNQNETEAIAIDKDIEKILFLYNQKHLAVNSKDAAEIIFERLKYNEAPFN